MKTQLTALMISLLIVPAGSAAVFAASSIKDKAEVASDNEVTKAQFKLHAYKSIGHPDVVTVDGVQVAHKLKLSSQVKNQLDEAKAQVDGTVSVRYIVPGSR